MKVMQRKDIKELYKVDELDREILRFVLKFPTATAQRVADYIDKDGVTPALVRWRRRKPAFIAAHNELLKTTDDLLRDAAKEAARALAKLVTDEDPWVRLKACQLILAPYTNQHTVKLAPAVVYDTTVRPDGTLLQQIIEGEMSEVLRQIEQTVTVEKSEAKK